MPFPFMKPNGAANGDAAINAEAGKLAATALTVADNYTSVSRGSEAQSKLARAGARIERRDRRLAATHRRPSVVGGDSARSSRRR